MADPSFGAAAKRHLADAQFLSADDRSPNADHLAGFAVECSLKSLVVGVLGGHVNPDDGFAYKPGADPEAPKGEYSKYKLNNHVGGAGAKSLWNYVASLLQSYPEPEFVALAETDDPFHDWHVSDRYSLGTHIDDEIRTRHLDAAELAMQALEAAMIANQNGAF